MKSLFDEYFREIQQVFLYVTNECGLRCEQCLYKPWLKKKEFDLETAKALLAKFRKLGASKLSLLGGEPTRYQHLAKLVGFSKDRGYEYVRMDTNGQFEKNLLLDIDLRKIDEISFSLDGHNSEINDEIRGNGSFGKCVANIKKAVDLGYNVNITCCIHRGNVGRDEEGRLLIERMIEFAASLGVSRINFHPLFKMGVPRDDWAGDTDILPKEWLKIYRAVRSNIEDGKYGIQVRIPQRFVTQEEFDKNPGYYGYCPVKMGERVLIHPNGQIQICALMIGTPYRVANFGVDSEKKIRIRWDNINDEIVKGNFDLNNPTPCTNQKKEIGDLVPLCISFKPNQDEFVWERLNQKWVLKFCGSRR